MSSDRKATRAVAGEPSWPLANDAVDAWITRQGGMLAPVSFKLGRKNVQPLALAPWKGEAGRRRLPPVLKAMRGDFFCLPFGHDPRGETPPHGHGANGRWRFVARRQEDSRSTLELEFDLPDSGKIAKRLELVAGHTALYLTHTLSGIDGEHSFGHHPILRFPAAPGSGQLTTNRLRFGQVFPGTFEEPEKGGYQSLRPGAWFERLDRVPLLSGESADLGRYPARPGFEDLVMFAQEPDGPFAWTAVAFPSEGYVWFSLKDPRLFPSTVLWMSNGGRHYPPWSGRHRNVMGVEDVCSYFNLGRRLSTGSNPWQRQGVNTCLSFRRDKPQTLPMILAVAAIPSDFGAVIAVEPSRSGVLLVPTKGKALGVPLDLKHLFPPKNT